MDRRDFLVATTAVSLVPPLLPSPSIAGGHSFAYEKTRRMILGSEMAYVDTGPDGAAGRTVVFLHGNPTSSYLWRNIIPYAEGGARVIAPDLIGMGDSDQPEIAYTYGDHAAHLHGLLDALDLSEVVLVLHDWGSALGFDWAEQNRDRVAGIAFMEAMLPPVMPFASFEAMGPQMGEVFAMLRSEAGAAVVLGENFFVEEILRNFGSATPLSDEVMAEYRRPFPTPESRLPTLQWPREIPIAGEPPETAAVIERYWAWFRDTDMPKLMLHAEPGALIPPQAAAFLQAELQNLTSVALGAGVHFVQEDHPDAIGRALADWLTTF